MALIGPGGRPITSMPPKEAPPKQDSFIKDSNLSTFAADVLEASREVPVIVDFWAPWCGPCKQLGPLLEAAVSGAKGAVRLVKVNIDENPEIAQQLRIQSIPTVFAFKDGQPIDGFMGALPESQVKAFVSALMDGHGGPGHAEELLALAAQAFDSGDISAAAQGYGHLLQDDPGNPKAVAGLASCYLKSGDSERARATLKLVRPDGGRDEAIRAVEAELALRESAVKAPRGEQEVLRARLAQEPNHHQARFDLALALDATGDRQGALTELLEIIRRDQKWNDDAARMKIVTLFEAMGPADPRTLEARRKLSALLFS